MRAGGTASTNPQSPLSPITKPKTNLRCESALDSQSPFIKLKRSPTKWRNLRQATLKSPNQNLKPNGSHVRRWDSTNRERINPALDVTVCVEQQHQDAGNVSYSCPYCPRLFLRKSVLNRHLRSHLDQKPFRCLHCPRSFRKKGNLARHLRSHLRQKTFRCKHCGKFFNSRTEFSSHLKTHEAPSCFHCSRILDPSRLQKTVNTAGPLKQPTCSTCIKAFVQSPTLGGKHLPMLSAGNRAQTAKKPFKCRHCGKSFTRRNLLTKHVRTRTLERPYKCIRCCKAFASSAKMAAHLRQHGEITSLVLPKLQ